MLSNIVVSIIFEITVSHKVMITCFLDQFLIYSGPRRLLQCGSMDTIPGLALQSQNQISQMLMLHQRLAYECYSKVGATVGNSSVSFGSLCLSGSAHMMLRVFRAVRAVRLVARAVAPFGAMSLALHPGGGYGRLDCYH